MKLVLQRCKLTETTTQGWLLVDGKYECYTLEDRWRDLTKEPKVPGETCVPEGIYRVILDYSTRFNRIMPHIMDIPYFNGIRIHPGNTEADTEGCILVGLSRSPDWVGQSRMAFNRLMAKLEDATNKKEDIELKIMLVLFNRDRIIDMWQEV